MKCDEAKPSCSRCTSTGRKCDGYASPNDVESKPTTPDSLIPALTVDVSCDALERRTFDFFRNKTGPCLSGYFSDYVFDRMMLQASHTEPTVRYAVNALASLHEENLLRNKAARQAAGSALESSDAARFRTSFPMKQYSKALIGLQKLLKAQDVPMDVVLMCSLLFVHFEAVRESFVSALVHAENAICILHSSTTFNSKKPDPSLVRAMMRVDLQGTMYLGMRVPGLPFCTGATDDTLPSSFHDLTQARDMVTTWTCRLFHFMRTEADDHKFREPGDVPLEAFAKAHDLEQTFLDLDELLWNFMHKPTVRLTIREQHGLAMLRSRVKMNRVIAAGCLYSEATMYDAYLEQFEEILTICKYIMSSDTADRKLLSVSIDEGLLNPLFFIATHCRDSRLRHQALAQMEVLPMREGIWHVEAQTRAAQVCIDYEESLCKKEYPRCEDIPEWRRIHSAGFDDWDISSPKRSVKAHMRMRPNGMDGEWWDVEEIIEWRSAVAVGVGEIHQTPGAILNLATRRLQMTWP